MISRRTCSVPKEDVCPRLLNSDSRCSQSCCQRSEACRQRSEDCHRRTEAFHRCSQTCRRRSQACRWRSQACRWRSQACCRRSQALPGAPKVRSGAPRCSQTDHNHSHGTPVAVICNRSYSEGRHECPPTSAKCILVTGSLQG